MAVLLYHGQDVAGIPAVLEPQGGFLGVEVFFVISGYLITSLLLNEYQRSSAIDLKDFWLRRARRLLPALYVFLFGTLLLAAAFAEDAVEKIREEFLGAVFYVTNWLLIFRDESYFEAAGRPSMLRHLWSLAIEEQFYLVWPLVVFFVLRRWGHRALFTLTIVGVVASTVLMWVLFDRVEQFGDVTSVYYRTDARAGALLIGAAAAFVWRPWVNADQPRSTPAWLRAGIDVVGLAALAAVVWVQYAFTDRVIEWDLYERLYHAGFLLTSVPTIVLIGVVVTPGSRLNTVLGTPVLRWIGTRSYGIYLWHWPVYQLTRPRVDVDIDGWTLLVVRLALTAMLVELSYRLVEMPVRERRFFPSLVSLTERPRRRVLAVGVSAVAVAVGVLTLAVTIPAIDHGSESVVVASDTRLEPTVSGTPETASDTVVRVTEDVPSLTPTQATPKPSSTVAPTAMSTPVPIDLATARIQLIGDSVTLGSEEELLEIAPGMEIYGKIGRQWWHVADDLRAIDADVGLGDVVILQLGNNGSINDSMFDEVMEALADVDHVVFVNVRVPKPWEGEVNAGLADGVARYPEKARLADWYAVANAHPEYFTPDGVHLEPPGQRALRALIEATLSP